MTVVMPTSTDRDRVTFNNRFGNVDDGGGNDNDNDDNDDDLLHHPHPSICASPQAYRHVRNMEEEVQTNIHHPRQQQQQKEEEGFYVLDGRIYAPTLHVVLPSKDRDKDDDDDDDNDDNNNGQDRSLDAWSIRAMVCQMIVADLWIRACPVVVADDADPVGSSRVSLSELPVNFASLPANHDTVGALPASISVKCILGGRTNVLYRVEGFRSALEEAWPDLRTDPTEASNGKTQLSWLWHHDPIWKDDAVLVRLFGAPGMIDRDVDTATYAALARQGFITPYGGRFAHGRLEGLLPRIMRPLQVREFVLAAPSIAVAMSTLHQNFTLPAHWSANSVPPNNNNKQLAAAAGCSTTKTSSGSEHGSVMTSQSCDGSDMNSPCILPSVQHQIEAQQLIGLWKELYDWWNQAASSTTFAHDAQLQKRAGALQLAKLKAELDWLRTEVVPPGSTPMTFCHNDVLAANVMIEDNVKGLADHNDTHCTSDTPVPAKICLIDYEYGGINYPAFDIANHWNEWAGGPPFMDTPIWDWLPTEQQQEAFVRAYLQAPGTTATVATTATATGRYQQNDDNKNKEGTQDGLAVAPIITDERVHSFWQEIRAYQLANHLYWGLWATNQAASQGCHEYDYMRYGTYRIQRYWHDKADWLEQRYRQTSKHQC